MANEVQFSFLSSRTAYFLVRNNVGQIWNTNTAAFEAYLTANFTKYTIASVEQGTASAYYAGSFPAALAAGVFSITAKQQLGGTALETDPTIGTGDFQWNGPAITPLSDLATSGLVGQFAPIRIYRGQMIQNFPFKLVSASDHITSFTSGVISGQVSRDGGSFGALQSGTFTEMGLGFYKLQALTSGDLLANTVALTFTGTGISGGVADSRDFVLVLQKTSGQL